MTEEQLKRLAEAIGSAQTVGEFIERLGRINSIDVVDHGHGMTAEEVQKYYLTIGTTHRLEEVENIARSHQPPPFVPAGEKGIGRLSAMRLGQSLEMLTVSEIGDSTVLVHVDWREFDFNRSERVEAIPIDVQAKEAREARSGTYIYIH